MSFCALGIRAGPAAPTQHSNCQHATTIQGVVLPLSTTNTRGWTLVHGTRLPDNRSLDFRRSYRSHHVHVRLHARRRRGGSAVRAILRNPYFGPHRVCDNRMSPAGKKPYLGITGTRLGGWVTVACTAAMVLFGMRIISPEYDLRCEGRSRIRPGRIWGNYNHPRLPRDDGEPRRIAARDNSGHL